MVNLRDGENQVLIGILRLLDLEATVPSEAHQEGGIEIENIKRGFLNFGK